MLQNNFHVIVYYFGLKLSIILELRLYLAAILKIVAILKSYAMGP